MHVLVGDQRREAAVGDVLGEAVQPGQQPVALRFVERRSTFLESAAENSYGMYLVHYVFVVWLQYALLGTGLPAIVKGVLVSVGVIALSWATTALMQRAPIGYRLIGGERRVLAKAPTS